MLMNWRRVGYNPIIDLNVGVRDMLGNMQCLPPFFKQNSNSCLRSLKNCVVELY